MAVYYLEGDAAHWFQWLRRMHGDMDWGVFVEQLKLRFGPTVPSRSRQGGPPQILPLSSWNKSSNRRMHNPSEDHPHVYEKGDSPSQGPATSIIKQRLGGRNAELGA